MCVFRNFPNSITVHRCISPGPCQSAHQAVLARGLGMATVMSLATPLPVSGMVGTALGVSQGKVTSWMGNSTWGWMEPLTSVPHPALIYGWLTATVIT